MKATPTPTKPADVAQSMNMVATPVPTPEPVEAVEDWVSIGASMHYKGDFPLIATRNPGFWDVHYGGSLNTVLIPSSPRFSQLIEYNPVDPTEIIGDLAKSWDIEDNGATYVFHLKDAKFSNGDPVTSADVVFSLDRITEPGALRARTGWLNSFYEHQTATAIDDKTVMVPLKFPAGAFLPNLATDYMKIYPKALADLSQDDFNCCPAKSYGSGPWVFRNYKKDDSYAFDRNDLYFKAPRPFFDGLQVYIISDNSRMVSALTAGQAYGLYQPISGGNRPEDMEQIEKDTNGRVRALSLTGASLQNFFLNTNKPPFDNEKVRQAFYIGLDRYQGVERAINGFGLPGTFFAPGLVEDLDKLPQTNLAYSKDRTAAIAEAKKLLTEAGYPDGFKAKINCVNTPPSLPACEVMTAQMRNDLNIDITIDPKDLATMYVQMRDGTDELSTVGTGLITRDPGDIFNQFYLQDVLRNPTNWDDPKVDDLIEQSNREPDPAKRLALVKQVDDILQNGVSHLVPYFWYTSGGALDYRIRNYHTPPTVQLVHKWDHVWFDENRKMPEGTGYVP